MPTVTVRQPATVKVRVEGQKTKVQTLSYGTKTLRSLTDLSLEGANTGDVMYTEIYYQHLPERLTLAVEQINSEVYI